MEEKISTVTQDISNKLRDLFSFKYNGFSDVIQWTDGAGFSRVKKSDNGYASLYKIGIIDKEPNQNSPLKKLWVSVSYGKETDGGISLGSETHKLSDPVDLDFTEEFSFDTKTQKLYYRNKEISALELIRTIEKTHLKPTKKLVGFPLRIKLWFWRKFLLFIITDLDDTLIDILWLISGEKTDGNIFSRRMLMLDSFTSKRPALISTPKTHFEDTKTMDFFGWKARRWSVVFFCTLHLILFLIWFFLKTHNLLISSIMKNSFLALCYVVVAFAVTEAGIPILLKYMISTVTPKVYSDIAFKRLKV